MKYKFSVAMPFEKNNIDKIISINKEINKSEIKSFYFSLPDSCDMFSGFEQARNYKLSESNFEYWKKLICYSLSKGIDFIYLLNNPCPISKRNTDFNKKLDKLDKLLSELQKLNISKLRVANPQLMSYLAKNYKYFDIYTSTSLDFKTISEYQNFLLFHPEVKQIIPSHDVNKNFNLLKNLKKDYPQTEIEIMVNEGCMQGCPHRYLHETITNDCDNSELYFSVVKYCASFCKYISNEFPFLSIVLRTSIFPWELNEYKKIGIINFKLVGRDVYTQGESDCINSYITYLKAIDDYKMIKDIPINYFIHHLRKNLTLNEFSTNEIKTLMPDIKHFVKYGHLCSSRCGVECRYCYKCAEKIKKVYEKKMKNNKKQYHNVNACIT